MGSIKRWDAVVEACRVKQRDRIGSRNSLGVGFRRTVRIVSPRTVDCRQARQTKYGQLKF